MAKQYKLETYVSLLQTLGKTRQQMWQSIKHHSKFKYTTNTVIDATIEAVKNQRIAASKLSAATDKTKVGTYQQKKGGQKPKIATVGFSFKFEFPSGSISGKTGKQITYFTIDVDPNLTKKQLRELIKAKIDDWIQENYAYGSQAGKGVRFKITDLK